MSSSKGKINITDELTDGCNLTAHHGLSVPSIRIFPSTRYGKLEETPFRSARNTRGTFRGVTKESRVLRGNWSVSRGASRRFPAREDARTKRRKKKKKKKRRLLEKGREGRVNPRRGGRHGLGKEKREGRSEERKKPSLREQGRKDEKTRIRARRNDIEWRSTAECTVATCRE